MLLPARVHLDLLITWLFYLLEIIFLLSLGVLGVPLRHGGVECIFRPDRQISHFRMHSFVTVKRGILLLLWLLIVSRGPELLISRN